MKEKKQPERTFSFEKALEELESIVEEIGTEGCPIDELETRVRRAAELISELRSRLSRTESIVTEILEGLDGEPGKTGKD